MGRWMWFTCHARRATSHRDDGLLPQFGAAQHPSRAGRALTIWRPSLKDAAVRMIRIPAIGVLKATTKDS